MQVMLSRRALCASLVLLPLAASAQQGLQTFDRTKLDIETKAGKYSFDIELALTPEQQAQGLMYRQKLATDAGMLFLYDHEQPLLMWMANTFIPLDMLFIAADGKIVNIAERTVPHSTVTIGSGALAQAVLELNGGTSARLGIGVGDRVVYAAFTLRR